MSPQGGVRIRSLRPDDAVLLADLHQRAFPSFFLSTLGPRFLREFYRGFCGSEMAVAVVAQSGDGLVLGAAVGMIDRRRYFRDLARRRWAGLGFAALLAVIHNPRALLRLLRVLRSGGAPVPAELSSLPLLSSICVDPAGQREGVGGQLLGAWEEALRDRGKVDAFLTTDAKANDAVVAFYRSRGWHPSQEFRTPEGRRLQVLRLGQDAAGTG